MNGRTPVPLRPSHPVSGTERDGRSSSVGRIIVATILGTLLAALISHPTTAAPAETTLVSSSPSNSATLGSKPARIVLTFSADIGDGSDIKLSCDAQPVDIGDVELGDDGRSMSTDLSDVTVGRGACSVVWSTVDRSGAPTGNGIVTFSIETAESPASVPADSTATTLSPSSSTVVPATTDPAATDDDTSDDTEALSRVTQGNGSIWLGRLLSTTGIALLFGALVTITAAWPEGVEYLVTIRFVRAVWILALVGAYVFAAAAAGAVSGDGFGAGLSPTSWGELLGSDWAGRFVVVRFVLVLACGWVAFRPDRVLDPVTQLSALGIPGLATATIGISRTLGELAIANVALGIVHALAMAVWFGGVVLVARVVLAGPGEEDLVHAVRGFGRISVVAIVVTIVSGIALMVRLDGGALLDSGHGRLVIFKTVVVAAMVYLALSARRFVGQRLVRAHEMSIPLASRLRRAFGAEAGIGAVTMALSAWLIALAPPNVDTAPTIDYDVPPAAFTDQTTGLDVVIRLTEARVGRPAGLEVDLRAPESGLTSLAVDFIAPIGSNQPGISQPVPLTAPGVAVRSESVGIPFGVAGDWNVRVRAVIGGNTVTTSPQVLIVAQADGSPVTTQVTIPAPSVVTIAPTTDN